MKTLFDLDSEILEVQKEREKISNLLASKTVYYSRDQLREFRNRRYKLVQKLIRLREQKENHPDYGRIGNKS